MPSLKQEQAIRQYYEQVKDQYPNLNFEDFKLVCKTPFEEAKKAIRSDDLPVVFIKYLGKFEPSLGLINRMINFYQMRIAQAEGHIPTNTPVSPEELEEARYKLFFFEEYYEKLKKYYKSHGNTGFTPGVKRINITDNETNPETEDQDDEEQDEEDNMD